MASERKLAGRAANFLRSHPEIVLFGFGLLLFLGGLLSVMTDLFDTGDDPAVARVPTVGGASPVMKRVGPSPGSDATSYIQARHEALQALGARDPRTQSLAVVSFASYLKVVEADQFFKTRKIQVQSVHLRIPLQGFDPEKARVTASIQASTAHLVGGARISALNEEIAALEEILPKTQDPAYRAVYEGDIENMRKAVGLLASDPSVIYGAVVKATHANLVKLVQAPGVRLVDVSEDPGADEATHDFRAILPEQTERLSSHGLGWA